METIFQFLLYPPFTDFVLALRVAFIIISIMLIVLIVYLVFRSGWLDLLFLWDVAEFMTFRPHGTKKIVKIWNKIKARLSTGLESEYKIAIIEADNMLNEVLKRMGYQGDTLMDRFKNITSVTLSNIESAKEAHQVRNEIVRNPDYKLGLDEVKKLLDIYERSLSNLDVF